MKIRQQDFFIYLIVFILGLVVVFGSIIPIIYGIFWNDVTLRSFEHELALGNDTLNNARILMDWENKNFKMILDSPPEFVITNSLGRIWMPLSWIIFSKAANCGEYTEVFAYFINKSGGVVRIILPSPEWKHQWAEIQLENGTEYVVNPYEKTFLTKKELGQRTNWTYINSYGLEIKQNGRVDIDRSTKKNVSTEYR